MNQKGYLFITFIVLCSALPYKPVFAYAEDDLSKKIDGYIQTAVDAGIWGLPNSPTGLRSRAFLDAVNRQDLDYVQDFIKKNLTPAFIGQFSMEEHLSIFKEMHKDMGEIDLLGANKIGEFTAELLIRSKSSGQRLRIFIELDPDEPYLISGLSI